MPRESQEENTGDRLTWRQALILLILAPAFIFCRAPSTITFMRTRICAPLKDTSWAQTEPAPDSVIVGFQKPPH
jgi:hypothetical protein